MPIPAFSYDHCHEKKVKEKLTANRRLGKWITGTCALAAVIASASLAQPVTANQKNNYYKCTSELVDVNVRAEEAERACSKALHPEKLAECVVKINRRTDIPSRDALEICSGVRRPLELATCVVDISDRTQAGAAFKIMNNCRRSLLPARYSQCVVGLNRRLDISVVKAMDSCIEAGTRVRELDPSFVPSDRQPLLPPSPTPSPANPPTPL
ncbi:MAG: hypothetical protein N3E45_15315 [Oscillatoriaceae bacterium SKW80]|nr:hypothetical protein [Oscillatoriaceae bacterium SKYG93]MCX8122168.1 hypothetical protein [Oscillatoriaceae bacterium SKW80]MDW8454455.1 hypothetical protein [Oscillatoriaceae cyanobacterium SKYGB_i_bin93]HIK29319.1 hypothetical protein [Oscillatoriaceae cyanobacterium M7585_C2015_266]